MGKMMNQIDFKGASFRDKPRLVKQKHPKTVGFYLDGSQFQGEILSLWENHNSSPTITGKRIHNYGKSPCYQWVNPCKSTISTGPFSSSQTVNLPEGNRH
jgi:hypothetical protein